MPLLVFNEQTFQTSTLTTTTANTPTEPPTQPLVSRCVMVKADLLGLSFIHIHWTSSKQAIKTSKLCCLFVTESVSHWPPFSRPVHVVVVVALLLHSGGGRPSQIKAGQFGLQWPFALTYSWHQQRAPFTAAVQTCHSFVDLSPWELKKSPFHSQE